MRRAAVSALFFSSLARLSEGRHSYPPHVVSQSRCAQMAVSDDYYSPGPLQEYATIISNRRSGVQDDNRDPSSFEEELDGDKKESELALGVLEKMLDLMAHGAVQTVVSVTDLARGGRERFDWSDEQRTGMFDAGNRAEYKENLATSMVYLLVLMVGFVSTSGFIRHKEGLNTPHRSTFQASSSGKAAYHPISAMNAMAKILLFGASAAMFLSRASSQSTNTGVNDVSCVSVVDALLDTSPCYQVAYALMMNGNTSIEANTVNVAVVVDGSGSISDYYWTTESSNSSYWSQWRKEKEFAKNIVSAFAERNLFENGGTASYVQFSDYLVNFGRFTSLEAFNNFVDEDDHDGGGTDIEVGMAKANTLLADNPSAATYMFVITDGGGTLGDAPANAAAAGTTVFAVGVGSIPENILLKITNGSDDAYFDVDDFDELDGTLDIILEDDRTSIIECEASKVEITVEFSAPVISADTNTEGTGGTDASISGRTVTFTADTLEDSSTEFVAWLYACESAVDDEIITSISYKDEEGNVPDTSFAEIPRLSEYDKDFPEPSLSGTIAANIISSVAITGFLVVSIGTLLAPSALGSLAGSSVGTEIGSIVPGDRLVRYDGPGDLRVAVDPSTPVTKDRVAVGVDGRAANTANEDNNESAHQNSSKRRPSATLGFLLMKQLQFLAMLSLVESIVSQYSWFGNFVRGLRWLNLWSPSDNEGPNLCKDDDVKISDLDTKVVVHNLALIIIILAVLLVAHVVVVSAIEAFWLTMKYATAGLDKCRGETAKQLARRLKGGPGINGMFPSRGPLAKCREISSYVWLYFPHMELTFLFYAFDGTVAAQVSALNNSDCPEVFYPSVIALMLYPLLMFVTTWRTIRVRVHPNDFLVFRYYDETDNAKDTSEIGGNSHLKKMLASSWKEGSLFAWADKGQWETVQINGDKRLESEWNWFRIGFEPMFADYTKSGTWFVLVSLVEWGATASVAALVEDSIRQLFLLLIFQFILLFVILCLRPFVNRVVNALETVLVVVNIITVALEGASAILYGETEQPQWVNLIESTLQIMVLVAVTIPLYIDMVVTILGTFCEGVRNLSDAIKDLLARQTDPEDNKRRRMVRGYTLRKWIPGWFIMIRHNVVACVRDTWRGLTRSGNPRDGISYPEDDHVDKGFDGKWPNDDFAPPPSYGEMATNGDLDASHRSDGGHRSEPPPSYEEVKPTEELWGEEKTTNTIKSQDSYPQPLEPRMSSIGWRGSMRVNESPFPRR